jgi:hypothetical protein
VPPLGYKGVEIQAGKLILRMFRRCLLQQQGLGGVVRGAKRC